MPAENVNIADQFKGLPMGDLIGGPLSAACDAQIRLARATAEFIQVVGFMPGKDKDTVGETRQVAFKFKRPAALPEGATAAPGQHFEEEVELNVPLLAIVKVPSLAITTVDITFDMEVKSSYKASESNDVEGSLSAEATFGFGPVKGKVNISGSVASHKENTRSSDKSAKYHISIHAEDKGMPEGLSRVMDILQTSCAPRRISEARPVALPAAAKPAQVTAAPAEAAPAPAAT
jgi:hypothetical protein